jgi:hypothetical protein
VDSVSPHPIKLKRNYTTVTRMARNFLSSGIYEASQVFGGKILGLYNKILKEKYP